jgi:hypothetical protein
MAVFQHLLERWGFVKLGRYGLVLTPDDRVLSTRAVALDDGSGGRIVGWRDDDLAMAELAPWPEGGPAHARAQVHVQFPARPAAIPPVRVALLPTPAIPPPSGPAPVAGPAASGAGMPVAVAPEAGVDEDDWEWTIALARARAEAEEPPAPEVQPPPVQAAKAEAPPMNAPPMNAPPADPAPRGRKTRQLPAAQEFEPAAGTAPAARLAPATVIPVPTLPSIFDAGRAARFEPVVRTGAQSMPPASPSWFAKGTAAIGADTEEIAAMTDDTEQSLAIGDRTTPGIGMPLAARAVALPSTKRRDERRG